VTARSLARPLIAGNWKMHKTVAEASAFIEALLPSLSAEESIDLVLCPAYLALRPMVEWTRGSRVEVYAQNMHHAPRARSPARSRRPCCSRQASTE
jgi:triosephosphate isomerase